jgi:hypothetical protein
VPSETLDLPERDEDRNCKSEICRAKETGSDGTTSTPFAVATLVLHEKGSKAS